MCSPPPKIIHLVLGLLLLLSSSAAFTPTGRPNVVGVPTSSFVLNNRLQWSSQKFPDTRTRLFQSSEVQSQPPVDTDVESEELDYLSNESIAENQQLLDAVVFANLSVLLFVGSAVLYSLFHTNVEALVALWEYDLGPHAPELTKIGVALELMARQPIDWIHNYEALIPTNPIFYKACTSGVAYTLGDFVSQVYQGKTLKTLDLPRSLRSGAAGFIAHGPLCHFWLLFMETYLDFGGAWWATGIKVTADLTVWSVFLNAAYSFIIGTLAMRPPKEVLSDVKVTLWPALRSAWRFWPFVHTISFSHAVPLDLKLLWVDAMEVVWVTILSKVANEDKKSLLEENPQIHIKDVSDDIPEVGPALEIELTREAELTGKGETDLAFELPKKVLAACWPLIVMWPVLYAGYRLEVFLGLEV